jgi:hypothetical protein
MTVQHVHNIQPFLGGMSCTSSDILKVTAEENAICLQYCKAVHDATYVDCIIFFGDQMLFSYNHIFIMTATSISDLQFFLPHTQH